MNLVFDIVNDVGQSVWVLNQELLHFVLKLVHHLSELLRSAGLEVILGDVHSDIAHHGGETCADHQLNEREASRRHRK